jgi:hypothetical protein
LAAAVMGLGLATGAAAGSIQVVSAPGEYAALHPRAAVKMSVATASGGDFRSTMDQVFGPGRWRQTSGYRTPAQEDALRRQGAGTVSPGRFSLHSLGAPDAPGAYDAVVDRMSPEAAAARLRAAGAAFARVVAEREHGPQGPHLHIELISTRGAGP